MLRGSRCSRQMSWIASANRLDLRYPCCKQPLRRLTRRILERTQPSTPGGSWDIPLTFWKAAPLRWFIRAFRAKSPIEFPTGPVSSMQEFVGSRAVGHAARNAVVGDLLADTISHQAQQHHLDHL